MFCPNCGTKLPDHAKFCSNCGSPVSVNQDPESGSQSTTEGAPQAEMCRVTIRRPNQFYVYNPAMKVFFDGQKIGAVKNGAVADFEVQKGTHTLCAAACFRKKKVTMSFSDDTELELKWNRMTGGIILRQAKKETPGEGYADSQSSTKDKGGLSLPRKKTIAIGGGVAAAILVILVLIAILGNGVDTAVSTVQNGYLGEYTDMTVQEMLDGYYGLLYENGAQWISGESENQEGVTIVQAEYSSELLGSAIIQFSMLDKQCFKVSAIADPMETITEASDTLALLNKIYVASYEARFDETEIAAAEEELLG